MSKEMEQNQNFSTDSKRHGDAMRGPGRGHGPGGPRGMGRPAEKPKDFKKTWKQLLSYNRKFLLLMGIALALAMTSSVFSLIGPDKLSNMTDLISQGILAGGVDLPAVEKIAFFLVGLYGCSAVFSYVQSFIMTTVTQKMTRNLRQDISRKINKVPLSYFN